MSHTRHWSPLHAPEQPDDETEKLEIEQHEQLEWNPGPSQSEVWRPSDHPGSPRRTGGPSRDDNQTERN
jgi:hypothetical protein